MPVDDNVSQKESRVLIKFLLENRMLMSYISILMIVYAVWATIEVLTNVSGATWWPPETGIPASELYVNPDNAQNINNGWVIGLGAVFGTIGIMIQYFYRAAPYVDASMQATAALIILIFPDQVSACEYLAYRFDDRCLSATVRIHIAHNTLGQSHR